MTTRLVRSPDTTLDLDLAAITDESRQLAASIKPGSARWDVIVVGSGAAGGMAAFQLAMAGIKVLMLEAGRMLDHRKEYRTMEWPYASPRRSRLPPDHRADRGGRVQLPRPPLRQRPRRSRSTRRWPPTRATRFTRNWVVNEKEHPTTGTPYSWVRARVLGGKTNFWGRGRAALRAAAVQGGQPRRLRRGLAHRATRTWRPTTTRSTCCSAARAPRKAWTRCRTASSSGPASSTASRCTSSGRSRRWAATTSPAARGSPPTAS